MSVQKDIIYIDVEDDIANIVEKIKKSSSKIVAIVPPKRIGVLQSMVNLRLIARAAKTSKKRVVIVTGNKSLGVLAGSAAIPVAKTLQSKPEIVQQKKTTSEKKEETVIAGDDMGDDGAVTAAAEPAAKTHAKSSDTTKEAVISEEEAAVAGVEAQEEAETASEDVDTKPKKRMVIPDFSAFRKKMAILGVLGVLIGAGLIWAIFFAPHAKITVSARTESIPISQRLSATVGAKISPEKMTIPAIQNRHSEDISAPITPTGEKDVGEKATGKVSLSRASSSSTTIPANTIIRNSTGLAYVTTEAAVIPATSIEQFFSTGVSKVSVSVVAAESGEQYNGAKGKGKISVAGVAATFVDSTQGGTTKVVKVITDDDVAKAKKAIEASSNENKARETVKKKFGEGSTTLDRTFTAKQKTIAPTIAVGKEVPDGTEAKLEAVYEYTMMGVSKADMSTYLTKVVTKTLDGSPNRKIFDNGTNAVSITNVDITDKGAGFTITTNAKVGPSVGEEKIRELVRGKSFSDARSSIEAINGVTSVDIQFSYFWVNAVPNDDEQITVEYNVDGK